MPFPATSRPAGGGTMNRQRGPDNAVASARLGSYREMSLLRTGENGSWNDDLPREPQGRSAGSRGTGSEQQERNRMADQLATEIIDKIKEHAEPGAEEITVNTELTSLGIHSLELTEIIFDLEEKYGIEIEMNTVEAWSNLKNVGDMIEAVRALIAQKG